jgi:CIC family chloride channel protein
MFAREVFALPVLDEDGELVGILSMCDITQIERTERAHVLVTAVYSRDVKYAFPDQTMHEVVERMREFHLANFPVVSRRDDKQLLGMITKGDIMLAYRKMALDLSL